jgi:hypothetical protein
MNSSQKTLFEAFTFSFSSPSHRSQLIRLLFARALQVDARSRFVFLFEQSRLSSDQRCLPATFTWNSSTTVYFSHSTQHFLLVSILESKHSRQKGRNVNKITRISTPCIGFRVIQSFPLAFFSTATARVLEKIFLFSLEFMLCLCCALLPFCSPSIPSQT